ncbi:hypothetical protein ACQZFR_04725 [Alcaligenes nematophilus]|uniref:hypothetical protein n=1 Tax=Alcaligenes nematophilus TaxID=2994643 RepID=UPI003D20203A
MSEALRLIAQLETEGFEFSEKDYEGLELTGEIATLFIGIDGPNFHGTITGGLARGLWHYQKEIYKAVAYAIYNNDNYGRIPRNELKNYTLVFEVNEGSTELIAKVIDIGKSLVEKAMDGLTSKEKAAFLLKIMLGFAGVGALTYVASNLSEDYFTHKTTVQTEELRTRQAEAAQETEQARLEAEIQRDRIQADLIESVINSDPVSKRIQSATAEGAKAIAKYNPEATKLQVGQEMLDREQIEELNQRSAREIPDMFNIVGFYRVTSTTEPTAEGFVRVGLAGNGDEFVALMNLRDEDQPFSEEQINAVFLAPKTGERIHMNVRVKRAADGIKEAYIEGFPPLPRQTEH